MGLFDFFKKKESNVQEQVELDKSLEKTKEGIFSKITKAVVGKTTVDDDVLDELEEILVNSDVGVQTTLKIIERIQARVARDKYINTSELNEILRSEIQSLLSENNSDDFVFDNEVVSQIFMKGYQIAEITCPTKYFEEASSINFSRSMKYGLGVLRVSLVHFLHKKGLVKSKLY